MTTDQYQQYVLDMQYALDRGMVLLTDEDLEFFEAIAEGDNILVGSSKVGPREIRRRYAICDGRYVTRKGVVKCK